MSFYFAKWTPENIFNKVAESLEEAGAVYAQETVLQISNPIWQWNYDTRRRVSLLLGGERTQGKPGVVVRAGKRDIVDTGRLLDSMTEPRVVRDQKSIALEIIWKAPYSGKVLQGGDYGVYTPPGQSNAVSLPNRPARNWIEAAFENKPPLDVFANIWRGGA